MPDILESYSEDGFHRQRRNLVVGSIVLFFYHIADVHVSSGSGALFGLPIIVGKTSAIQWFLFAAVLYWGLRFFQYRKQRPVELQRVAQQEMMPFLERHALEHVQVDGWRTLLTPPKIPDGRHYKLVPFDFHVEPPRRHNIVARVKPAWHVFEGEDLKESNAAGSEYQVVYEGRVLWQARILGYAKACFSTPAFTDYILPYIIFAVSIGYAAYRVVPWKG